MKQLPFSAGNLISISMTGFVSPVLMYAMCSHRRRSSRIVELSLFETFSLRDRFPLQGAALCNGTEFPNLQNRQKHLCIAQYQLFPSDCAATKDENVSLND